MRRGGLTDRGVKSKKTPGAYSDGDGLRLRVRWQKWTAGAGEEKQEQRVLRRSWVLRYTSPTITNRMLAAALVERHRAIVAAEQQSASGKRRANRVAPRDPASVRDPDSKAVRELWIGNAEELSLAEARLKAAEKRQIIHQGKDPLPLPKSTKRQRLAQEAAQARKITFRECAEQFIASKRNDWKSHKHAGQWRSTLETYAYPIIGNTPVIEVDRRLVLAILDPQGASAEVNQDTLWRSKRETANRVRSRIKQVLDWAQARGYRKEDQLNPARWEGSLRLALPGGRAVKHHAAVPFGDIPEVMQRLRKLESVGARCAEFLALTAVRYGEAAGLIWGELDLTTEAETWTIPVARRKGKLLDAEKRTPLSIPLSPRAVEILRDRRAAQEARGLTCEGNQLVFESPMRWGKPLSAEALLKVLREGLDRTETSHGFRSSFRTWVSEETTFQSEVAEAALGHVNKDKTEAAYQRGDLFKKRRALMNAWAEYCSAATNASSDVQAPQESEAA